MTETPERKLLVCDAVRFLRVKRGVASKFQEQIPGEAEPHRTGERHSRQN
jgi:hypothetical protein